jgi:hypothetical protein
MPELVRLYIRHCLIGFAIAAVFVAGVLWLNVANLQHLVFNTRGGMLALFMLFFFNGLLFAGVQFAIAVMGMAERPDSDGGRPVRLPMADALGPVPVRIPAEDPVRRA